MGESVEDGSSQMAHASQVKHTFKGHGQPRSAEWGRLIHIY